MHVYWTIWVSRERNRVDSARHSKDGQACPVIISFSYIQVHGLIVSRTTDTYFPVEVHEWDRGKRKYTQRRGRERGRERGVGDVVSQSNIHVCFWYRLSSVSRIKYRDGNEDGNEDGRAGVAARIKSVYIGSQSAASQGFNGLRKRQPYGEFGLAWSCCNVNGWRWMAVLWVGATYHMYSYTR